MGCICGKASPVEDNREGLNEKQADLVMPSGTSSRREGSFRVNSSRRDGSFRVKERPDGGGSRFGSIKKANGSRRVRGDHFEKKRENSGVVVPDYPGMGNMPKAKEGEQVAAGWPSWLAAVAGEAINGWLPRSVHTFEILEKIGKGTYSSVYKARDLKHKKFVALKKVRFDNMDPESVKFMAREILILRRLDHPNVIKLEGLVSSRTSCSLYLVFEYMEHDLTGLASLPGIKFTEPQIKCYMQQLLSGLHHCHSHGILHRDIKGSNLLIDNHGILKIADFGLANFFDQHRSFPLTSRVVTLWYRPPELLLGATHYGVSVDLWSTGCILGELYAGKAVMPGRTEIEQLHKIFKLCGSPSEDYWRKSKLPRSTGFRSLQPYKRRLAETFKDFPLATLGLMETLLSIDPAHRGTADAALKSEFFTTKPFACDPSSLPKYPPSKEIDARLRDEEARRQETTRGRGKIADQEIRGPRKSQAIPAPDANAELVTSMQRRPYHSNSKSRSELFNPHQEEAALGFPIDPPRQKDPLDHIPKRVAHSGPLVPGVEWTKTGKKYDDISVMSTRADLSKVSGLLASRTSSSEECQDKLVPKRSTHSGPLGPVVEWTKAGKKYDDISIVSTRADFSTLSGLLVSRTSSVEDRQQRATTQVGMFSESYKESGPTRRQERKCYTQSSAGSGRIEYGKHTTKEPVPHRQGVRGNRIHFSGPLLVPSNNVDQMLKEHNRHIHEHDHHIQESARRARRVEFQAQGLQVAPNPLHMPGRGAG